MTSVRKAGAVAFALAMIASASVAQAEDGSTGYNWTGFYIGAGAGYGAGDFEGVFDSAGVNGVPSDTGMTNFPPAADALIGPLDIDLTSDGFVGSGFVGYQRQLKSGFVIGFEASGAFTVQADDEDLVIDGDDANFGGLPGPVFPGPLPPNVPPTTIGGIGPGYEQAIAEVDYTLSARVRAGYAFERFLPYLTGGVGLVGYQVDVTNFNAPATGVFGTDPESGGGVSQVSTESFDKATVTPVLGAGFNFALTDNILLGGEFLYFFADERMEIANDQIVDADAGDGVDFQGFYSGKATLTYKF